MCKLLNIHWAVVNKCRICNVFRYKRKLHKWQIRADKTGYQTPTFLVLCDVHVVKLHFSPVLHLAERGVRYWYYRGNMGTARTLWNIWKKKLAIIKTQTKQYTWRSYLHHNRECFNCGIPGHLIRDCEKLSNLTKTVNSYLKDDYRKAKLTFSRSVSTEKTNDAKSSRKIHKNERYRRRRQ